MPACRDNVDLGREVDRHDKPRCNAEANVGAQNCSAQFISRAGQCTAPTLVVLLILLVGRPEAAHAFPPYQQWISKKAGFEANCAYCHLNANGPIGKGAGQEGRLNSKEQSKLHSADSPILNSFGRQLIKRLGYERFVAGVSDPGSVVAAIKSYDLDGDGVSDGVEMEHGTLAFDPLSAPPQLVWMHRLKESLGFVLTVAISGIVGALGLAGLAKAMRESTE